jgi:EmrB/QacA subfamily drug resistance transporter
MFIAALEATVVGTAMPTVISSLGGLSQYSWVFSAYLVTSTVTVPVWGKLSDLYGRRLLYQIGIAFFLLGTLLSGFSASMPQLIFFRAIQGLGAGALIPLGMTIIGDMFNVEERTRMQALFSGVWGLSSVIGPVIGGFITDQVSWRWVFWVNVPLGIGAAVIIGISLEEPHNDRRPVVDYAGAALLMAALSLFLLGLVEGGSSLASMFAPRNLWLFVAAGILMAVFVYIERRAVDPVIPFAMFANRTVSVAVTAGFLGGIAMFGIISFIPLFAQGALGYSATEAGSLLTPLMLTWVTMSIIGSRLMLRVGYRGITIFGFAILGAGFILLALFDTGSPQILLYLYLMMIGAGLGLTMLTLLIAVQHAVDRTQLGVATSLNQFSRSIGGAIGVAAMGVILSAGMSNQLAAAAQVPDARLTMEEARAFAANPNALIEPAARERIDPRTLGVLQHAIAAAINPIFWASAFASLLALLVVIFLPAPHQPLTAQVDGERMIMAEQTSINRRNQPVAED